MLPQYTMARRNSKLHFLTSPISFQLMDVSMLHLKRKLLLKARAVSHSTTLVTWCPLTTRIVPSKCPSWMTAEHAINYLVSLGPGCINVVKAIIPDWNMFAINPETSLAVILIMLISIGHRISLKLFRYWHRLYDFTSPPSVPKMLIDAGHVTMSDHKLN